MPACQKRTADGTEAIKRIGRMIIYVMLVITVLLIIWQLLGSL